MMKLSPIGLAFALALTGCADSSGTGDDTGGDGSGSQQEPQPEPQMDAQGAFRVNSTFDVATNMPGASGNFLNGLIAATDDPDDPMSWLVDQMLAKMDDGTLKDEARYAFSQARMGYEQALRTDPALRAAKFNLTLLHGVMPAGTKGAAKEQSGMELSNLPIGLP